jgi:hypothetical protein
MSLAADHLVLVGIRQDFQIPAVVRVEIGEDWPGSRFKSMGLARRTYLTRP